MQLTPADLCHPVLRPKPFSAEGWLFELKHDGFRAFVRTGAKVELLTRQGNSLAAQFPDVMASLRALDVDAVLDAELVVPVGARSDFSELLRRSRMRRQTSIVGARARRPAALIVFDVLQMGHTDLRSRILLDRKTWLRENIEPRPGLQVAESIETQGEALFALAVDRGFEGVVGKKMDSLYRRGTRADWQKAKNPAYSRGA